MTIEQVPQDNTPKIELKYRPSEVSIYEAIEARIMSAQLEIKTPRALEKLRGRVLRDMIIAHGEDPVAFGQRYSAWKKSQN
jgi:hypothetical protein